MHQVFVGINTGLALLGVAAVFGALNKMRVGSTRPCVIMATGLIGVGLAGQALGLAREEWAVYADTALYGGVLALVIASQRVHTWFLERFANPVATLICVVIGSLFFAGLLSGCTATAPRECDRLSMGVIEQGGAPLFVLDLENMRKLAERMRDLQDGKCRLPPREGTGV